MPLLDIPRCSSEPCLFTVDEFGQIVETNIIDPENNFDPAVPNNNNFDTAVPWVWNTAPNEQTEEEYLNYVAEHFF